MNRITPFLPPDEAKLADHYEQGRLFEEYVKNLFNEKSFKLKRWRKSALISPDTFISDISYPDLELVFVRENHYPFAVECKWRSNFDVNGKIDWAREDQIKIYLNFQKNSAIPVFIAIGIGNTPSDPEKLFVTPLKSICKYPEVYEHQLIRYKRKPARRFFYDTVQKRL
jgi:hypothetical protein